MTEKPLDLEKNKIKKWVKEDLSVKVYADIDRAIELTINKLKQRIKSAVQGLLEDIDKIELTNKTLLDLQYEIKQKIKKWFPEANGDDRVFDFKDVKSAVQGLLDEINLSYGCVHHREEGGNDDCIICVAIGQTLNEVRRKIKKWFSDVLKEGERQ